MLILHQVMCLLVENPSILKLNLVVCIVDVLFHSHLNQFLNFSLFVLLVLDFLLIAMFFQYCRNLKYDI